MRTPAGQPVIVPTPALAQAIEREWVGQGQKIDAARLRLSPLVYVALDMATAQRDAMLEDIIPYIDTDLVCYRAGDNAVLSQRQAEGLDPVIAWLLEFFSLRLLTTHGIMPVLQPQKNQNLLRGILARYDIWKLSAVCVATKALGSMALALALVEGYLSASQAYALAHLEETYETEQWGKDDEKETRLQAKESEIQAVSEFLAVLS